MKDERKTRLERFAEELDESLGGLLGELGATLSEVVERLDHLEDGELSRERRVDTPRGSVSAGIRVRVGGLMANAGNPDPTRHRNLDRPVNRAAPAGGRAQARDRAQPGLHAPPEAGHTEPAYPIEATILLHDGTWSLVAELPGVAEGDLVLRDADGGTMLRIEAQGRHGKYAGEFEIPDDLGAADLACSLVNGVLQLHGRTGAT